jgi:hypothetical protein
MAKAPPGNTAALLIKNALDPPFFTNRADTLIVAPVVLAIDKPIRVAACPAVTVGVKVLGLASIPMFAVIFDLKAILCPYPKAIAIATA